MARLPRNRRVDDPPPMRLTERDVAIIKAVHDSRVLRGDQVQALFFGSQSTVSYRLSRLYQHGFLERHFLPTVGGLASSPTLYALDKRGVAVLREVYGYGPEEIRRASSTKELSPLFLEHALQINDVRVAVTLAARAQGFALEQWLGEADLKADYDQVTITTARGHRQDVALIPDSYFVLQVPQGRACFFLELDRGTMTVGRFKAKVKAYQAYIVSGQYRRRYQTRSLRILTVTSGPKRLENLKHRTEEAGGRRVFWFTSLDDITPETVLTESVWKVAGSEGTQPLIAPE